MLTQLMGLKAGRAFAGFERVLSWDKWVPYCFHGLVPGIRKIQIPNPKSQTNSKFPNSKVRRSRD